MSSFRISNFTLPGAYVSAVKAAEESDRRNAVRYSNPIETPARHRKLRHVVRWVATALADRRSVTLRLTSHQA
jgi:hypothetical protein